MALAENLIRIRKEKGFTQTDLENRIRSLGGTTNQTTLSRIESGDHWPEHPTLAFIAKALGVPETDLTSEPKLLKLRDLLKE